MRGPGRSRSHGRQAWKRSRLAELGIEQPRNLVFIPVDFEHQKLIEALQEGGPAPASRAVVSWLGVTMYLTRDAIEDTLGVLASLAAGSRVVRAFESAGCEARSP